MIKNKETVYLFGLIMIDMKENIRMIKWMEKAKYFIAMATHMMVNLLMEKWMVKENLFKLMVQPIKGILDVSDYL